MTVTEATIPSAASEDKPPTHDQVGTTVSKVPVPFEAANEIFGFAVPLPYLPHRDPRHPSFRPVPSPRLDPYWMAELATPPTQTPDAAVPKPLADQVEPEPVPDQVEPEPVPDQVEPEPVPDQVEPEPVPDQVEPEPVADQVEPESVADQVEPEPVADQVPPEFVADQVPPEFVADQVVELDAYSETDVAVVQQLSLPAELVLDTDPCPRAVQTADGVRSFITGRERGAEDGRSEPVDPPRVDHRLDNKKLNNVLFDSDGHIGFTTIVHTAPRAAKFLHIDDPQSATDALAAASLSQKARAVLSELTRPATGSRVAELRQSEVKAEPEPVQQVAGEPALVEPVQEASPVEPVQEASSVGPGAIESPVGVESVTPVAGSAPVIQILLPLEVPYLAAAESTAPATRTAKASGCGGGACELSAADACDPERVLSCVKTCECVRQWREMAQRCRVGLLYASWGLSADDAHTDVVTGFQRVGSVQKRHALALGSRPRQNATLELTSWGLAHVRVILTIDAHPVLVECVQEDQVVRCIKDFLWILFNNGAPLNLTLIDHLPTSASTTAVAGGTTAVAGGTTAVAGGTTEQQTVEQATHIPGKFYSANLTAVQLLQGLVQAWGGTFTHLHTPTTTDDVGKERLAELSFRQLLKKATHHTKCA
ncbi:hypothetical protein GNI_098930 [Gregarina niphandrodes]|uniref:Uncharacterized protein n=1 Tax=Gregarina niphandrodes TaxID=110365 RepID=A0A023B4Y5_GRENI|nr:hypothetical protein GNI_098930 [Gregarina niphandrodes]EZG57178.1 hypothetical protein GNI_098930 [Gregarina niphandrodes]|eukprot:XP_011131083.1 hypothetical protein GNI_098930 [Gregarina niphandrodes]